MEMTSKELGQEFYEYQKYVRGLKDFIVNPEQINIKEYYAILAEINLVKTRIKIVQKKWKTQRQKEKSQ